MNYKTLSHRLQIVLKSSENEINYLKQLSSPFGMTRSISCTRPLGFVNSIAAERNSHCFYSNSTNNPCDLFEIVASANPNYKRNGNGNGK